MRKFIRSLASLDFKVKAHSSWGEKFPDGFLVEVFNAGLSYEWERNYSIKDTRLREPLVIYRSVVLFLTLLNLNLILSVGWEAEP